MTTIERKLGEILRPHVGYFLVDYNQGIQINEEVILAATKKRTLIIAREKNKPIKFKHDGSEAIYPYLDEAEREGKFGALIIRTSSETRTLYIGEDYEVIYARAGSAIAIRLNSSLPISPEAIVRNGETFETRLERLRRKKV